MGTEQLVPSEAGSAVLLPNNRGNSKPQRSNEVTFELQPCVPKSKKLNGGFEPPTAALQVQRSTTELIKLAAREHERRKGISTHVLTVYKSPKSACRADICNTTSASSPRLSMELTPELVADLILLVIGLVVIYFKGDDITRYINEQSRAYREGEADDEEPTGDDGGDSDSGRTGSAAAAKKDQ